MSYGSGPNPYPAGQAPYGAPQQFGAPALSPDIAPLPGAGFGEAVKRFFQRYAQFRGYASRSEYWWPWLLNTIISFVLSLFTVIPMLTAMTAAIEAAQNGEPPIEPAYSTGVLMMSGVSSLYSLAPIVGPIWLLVLLASEARPDLYRPEWS